MRGIIQSCFIATALCSIILPTIAEEDYKSEQLLADGNAALKEVLQSHPDIVEKYFPNKESDEEYNRYRESFPSPEDFVIGILVNPCGANGTYGRDDDIALGYDCCMERYGRGEYSYRPGTRNRFSNGYSNGIPISPDEPLHNVDLVDEFGNDLEFRYSRRANDILFIDESCVGLRDPHMACISDRFAATASRMRPPCWDNNHTVDSTLDCYTPAGNKRPHCMQIAYSQNALVFGCGGKFANYDNCGTFLEIHKPNGSPYDDEAAILSESKISVSATNGMMTTTIPLTYKGDPKRILCSYEEVDISVGSMVRVHSDSPVCCCPPWLSPMRSSKIGASFCPKRLWSKEGGPFAPAYRSVDEEYMDESYQQSFPWCPELADEHKDSIMCTQDRVFADDVSMSDPSRYFVLPCSPLEEVDGGGYTSVDVSGIYNNLCPYGDTFKGCGLAMPPNQDCHMKDFHFSFKDEIGKVVRISDDKKYGVSFNDGRSLYWFDRNELEFLKPDGSYEVWFVQRNRYEKNIQKRKPFRVVWPRCTFDAVNDRYFPYAQLDGENKPITVISSLGEK